MAEKKEISTKLKGWWNSLDKTKVLIWVFAGLIAVSFIFYMCYFNGGISSEHKRWSEFGDYIAGIAGILNVMAIIALNVLVRNLDKKRAEQETRLHAEELVVKKLQRLINIYYGLYMEYIKTKSRYIVRDTFEFLQPLMTYLFFLKGIGNAPEYSFLPNKTKELVVKFHEDLFGVSDQLWNFACGIKDETELQKQEIVIFKIYRDLYKRLLELETTMMADIAGVKEDGRDSNYREAHPEKTFSTEN